MIGLDDAENAAGPTIREEATADAAAIREVHRRAFDGEAEGRLVDLLRAEGLNVASVVAVVEQAVVGHALFSRLPIERAGAVIAAAALAPVAVLPEHQRRGFGSLVVRRGLTLCRERGIGAVVVVGDPAYYGRFAFSASLARGLASPYGGPAFQALELVPGTLAHGGTVRYPEALQEVD